jgi:dihydrofolate synthase / folylpolyglutamate synthase
LGISSDKNFRAMIETLAPLADAVFATQSSSPRSASADEIAREARKFCSHVEIHVPPQAALDAALLRAAPNDVVCVTGSFFNLAEISHP